MCLKAEQHRDAAAENAIGGWTLAVKVWRPAAIRGAILLTHAVLSHSIHHPADSVLKAVKKMFHTCVFFSW